MTWESPFVPSYDSKDMLISLPGTLKIIYLEVAKTFMTLNISVTVYWIANRESQNAFKLKLSSKECKKILEKSETCTSHSISNSYRQTTYFIIGYLKFYYYQRYITKLTRHNKSWNEALDVCAEIGAHLPFFNSKVDLNEFVDLLKQPGHVPLIEMVFIGLYSNLGKVCKQT